MMNRDMKTSMAGVLVLRARESDRLPGFMATAVMLLRSECCFQSLALAVRWTEAKSMGVMTYLLEMTVQRIHP